MAARATLTTALPAGPQPAGRELGRGRGRDRGRGLRGGRGGTGEPRGAGCGWGTHPWCPAVAGTIHLDSGAPVPTQATPPTPNGRAQRQAGRGGAARQGPRPTEQQRRVSCGRGGGRAAQDSALRSKQTSNPWCPVSGDGVVRRPGRTETDYDVCYTGRVS